MSNHIKPIGFIGIGLMGNCLVKRLIKKEYTINIYDKNKEFEKKVNPESVVWQNLETDYWRKFLKKIYELEKTPDVQL